MNNFYPGSPSCGTSRPSTPVTDLIDNWISKASEEQLEYKIAQYSGDQSHLSPRDTENRLRIKLLCQNELARRRLTNQEV